MKKTNKLVKFLYYQLLVDRQGETKLFDLTQFANIMEKRSLERRNWDYNGDPIRLKKFYLDENNLLQMQFERLTDGAMPYIAKENKEDEKNIPLEADEFIANDINAIFDFSNCVLMMQRNIQSLSQKSIEQYINHFWNLSRADEEKEIISFNPILNSEIYSKASRSQGFKKLIIKTANKYDSKKGVRQKISSSFGGTLENIMTASQPVHGLNIELTFSTARSKDDTLDDTEIKNILKQIKQSPQSFDKAQISIIDENDKTEVLNLLNALLIDMEWFEQPPKSTLRSDVILDRMIRFYLPSHEGDDRKSDINSILRYNNSEVSQ